MSFSNTTLSKLAKVITPDVCDAIFKDPRYAEFMQNIIPDILSELFNGKISDDLNGELSMIIFDNINIEPFKK